MLHDGHSGNPPQQGGQRSLPTTARSAWATASSVVLSLRCLSANAVAHPTDLRAGRTRGRRTSVPTAGKNNLCIAGLPHSRSRASFALIGNAAKVRGLRDKLALRAARDAGLYGEKGPQTGAGQAAWFLLRLCLRWALWLSGGGLKAFSRINSGNSELYRRRRKNVAVARWIVDNCRSAKSPSERGTYG